MGGGLAKLHSRPTLTVRLFVNVMEKKRIAISSRRGPIKFFNYLTTQFAKTFLLATLALPYTVYIPGVTSEYRLTPFIL